VFFSSKVNPELFGGELLIISLVSMTFKDGGCFAVLFESQINSQFSSTEILLKLSVSYSS